MATAGAVPAAAGLRRAVRFHPPTRSFVHDPHDAAALRSLRPPPHFGGNCTIGTGARRLDLAPWAPVQVLGSPDGRPPPPGSSRQPRSWAVSSPGSGADWASCPTPRRSSPDSGGDTATPSWSTPSATGCSACSPPKASAPSMPSRRTGPASASPPTSSSRPRCPSSCSWVAGTTPKSLFGSQRVETYLDHLRDAVDLEMARLGPSGTFEVFAEMRRLSHRLGLASWAGERGGLGPLPRAPDPPVRPAGQLGVLRPAGAGPRHLGHRQAEGVGGHGRHRGRSSPRSSTPGAPGPRWTTSSPRSSTPTPTCPTTSGPWLWPAT